MDLTITRTQLGSLLIACALASTGAAFAVFLTLSELARTRLAAPSSHHQTFVGR